MKTSLRLYKCGTCAQQKELLLRQSAPDLLNCVMTPSCQGLMTLISTRAGTRPRGSLALLDKPIRGYINPVAEPTSQPGRFSIQAGQTSLALALYKAEPGVDINTNKTVFSVPYVNGEFATVQIIASYKPSTTAVIELVELVNDELLLRKYSFNKSGIKYLIEGEDDSQLRRTLRIGVNEQVKLIVNGIELDAANYEKQLNKLVLTPPITNSTIDVYVYREAATVIGKVISLTFECPSITSTVDLEHRKLSSWGKSVATDSDFGERITAYSFGAVLDKTKAYIFKRAYALTSSLVERALDLTNVALLTGSPPYAFEDKRIDQYVKLVDLVGERITVQSFPDGSLALVVGEAAFTDSKTLVREVQPIQLLTSPHATSILQKPAARYTIGPI